MSIFNIKVWQGDPNSGVLVWQSDVLASDIATGYEIGKMRFGAENPSLNPEDYVIVANGVSVEKSISV